MPELGISCISQDADLHFYVPQGFAIGPTNYNMCTKLVDENIKRQNIKYQYYVKNTQVFMTLKPCDKWNDISSSLKLVFNT